MCDKRVFGSKGEAKRAARQVETAGNGAKVGRIVVYRCRDCGGIHIGHRAGWRSRRAS